MDKLYPYHTDRRTVFFRRQEFLPLLLVSAYRSPDQGKSELSVAEGHVNPDSTQRPYSDSWGDNWLVERPIALSCCQHPGGSLHKQFTFQCSSNALWLYVIIYYKLSSFYQNNSFYTHYNSLTYSPSILVWVLWIILSWLPATLLFLWQEEVGNP